MKVIRVLRAFEGLRLMVASVMQSGTSLFWVFVLFFIHMYLFSLYFVNAIVSYLQESKGDDIMTEPLLELFGSVLITMHTLFQAVTGGISWIDISKLLLRVHW